MRSLLVVVVAIFIGKIFFTDAEIVKGVVVEGLWIGLIFVTVAMILGGIIASWKSANK